MTHPEEIQNEIALLSTELEHTARRHRVEAIRERLAQLSRELAGYFPIQ